jgi:hypothetical protein
MPLLLTSHYPRRAEPALPYHEFHGRYYEEEDQEAEEEEELTHFPGFLTPDS